MVLVNGYVLLGYNDFLFNTNQIEKNLDKILPLYGFLQNIDTVLYYLVYKRNKKKITNIMGRVCNNEKMRLFIRINFRG